MAEAEKHEDGNLFAEGVRGKGIVLQQEEHILGQCDRFPDAGIGRAEGSLLVLLRVCAQDRGHDDSAEWRCELYRLHPAPHW